MGNNSSTLSSTSTSNTYLKFSMVFALKSLDNDLVQGKFLNFNICSFVIFNPDDKLKVFLMNIMIDTINEIYPVTCLETNLVTGYMDENYLELPKYVHSQGQSKSENLLLANLNLDIKAEEFKNSIAEKILQKLSESNYKAKGWNYKSTSVAYLADPNDTLEKNYQKIGIYPFKNLEFEFKGLGLVLADKLDVITPNNAILIPFNDNGVQLDNVNDPSTIPSISP